jgi:hypothetical protein
MNKIKNWIREIIREVFREEIQKTPLIINMRIPKESDVYGVGTKWVTKEDTYTLVDVKATWEKVEGKGE